MSPETFYLTYKKQALVGLELLSHSPCGARCHVPKFEVWIRLWGDGRVIKGHLKEADAVKRLCKKAFANASKKLPPFETNSWMQKKPPTTTVGISLLEHLKP